MAYDLQVVKLPLLSISVTLDEATAKFTSISNVLQGIREFDRGGALMLTPYDVIATRLATRVRNPVRTLERDATRHLRIAWQTELAARVSEQIDDPLLRRVAAQTLPVQTYYALFNAARAASAARGSPCDTHRAVHNDYQSQYVRRGYGSWGVSLTGDPEDVAKCAVTPSTVMPVSFNAMERHHDPEDYVFAALRMTRRWKIAHAREDWLRANKLPSRAPRKRLPAADRANLINRLRATTIMDFIYELRVRTNYEGNEEYGSEADDATVQMFHSGLLHAADVGLLHYETSIACNIGLAAYETMVDDWITTTTRVGSWAREAVDRRRASIMTALTP